jgi:segregation and condensation protein B
MSPKPGDLDREPVAMGPGRLDDRPSSDHEPETQEADGTADGSDVDDALDRLAGATPGPGAQRLAVEDLEALLFVAEKPLSRREIATVAGVDAETVDATLGDLEVQLRERGIRLIASGERVQLVTSPGAGALIARYIGAEGQRLSPAALETLAIVAYRQPVTRGAIERIRGVDSDYVVRTLLHRRLVAETGRADTPGRPILYGTGFEFLQRFGLTSLDELPVLDADVAARLAEEGGPPAGADDAASDDAALDVADDGDGTDPGTGS